MVYRISHILALVFLYVAGTLHLSAVCRHDDSNTDSVSEISRPVYSVFTLGVGSAHMSDTYLSPLKYSGTQGWFSYSRLQAMKFDPERWVMRLGGRIQYKGVENSRGNNIMRYFAIDASWGMLRRFVVSNGFSVGIGGATSIEAGALVNQSNGNNPVSARASWTLDLTGYGSWRGHIGRLPVTCRVDATIPVTGIFFSPEYGELYYEIYLGNHSGLVHPVWWGSYTRFNTHATVSLHFNATTLQIGYMFDTLSTSVNNLITNDVCHSFTLGIATEWIALPINTHNLSCNARIISATY